MEIETGGVFLKAKDLDVFRNAGAEMFVFMIPEMTYMFRMIEGQFQKTSVLSSSTASINSLVDNT